MKIVEKSGKTVDEAIEMALAELNAVRSEVEVEILDTPTRGLFGLIGNKGAKVKVILREKGNQENIIESASDIKKEFVSNKEASLSEKPEDVASEFLGKIFNKLGVEANIEVEYEEDFLYLSLTGEDLGILIGRRGETLYSLQYLVNLVVAKRCTQRVRVVLDVEGYRKRREQTLTNLAYRLSEKVKKTGHNIVLEPMNPHERRIIHTALQNDQKVRTFSEGEEPYRKVVITRKSRDKY